MSTVVLCVDLMDRSKIGAAHPDAVFVRSAAALAERCTTGAVTAVIVDLSRPDALAAIEVASAAGVGVTAFGSHVDEAMLAAARDAGATDVVPRSRFFARLG
jgi:uncharacterized membrane protein